VSLKFSLVDNPRTQIEDCDLKTFPQKSEEAYALCVQWGPTGAITLIASDAVWKMLLSQATSKIWPTFWFVAPPRNTG
jgi:hypothetical protein